MIVFKGFLKLAYIQRYIGSPECPARVLGDHREREHINKAYRCIIFHAIAGNIVAFSWQNVNGYDCV